MITVSLCMIVKNEEAVLERCISSTSGIADEVIVVDTGSSDQTVEIAKKLGCKVYRFNWCDDFSKARNYSFSKATKSHIMWLDADDVISDNDRKGIIELKNTLSPTTDTVMMLYNVAFDEFGTPTFSYYRERIVKNSPQIRWSGKVHETLEIGENIIYSDFSISHKKQSESYSTRNLSIYRAMQNNGETFSPRDKFYFARELYYHNFYEDAEMLLTDFIDSGDGWVENRIDAYRILADIMQNTNRPNDALKLLLASLSEGNIKAEVLCEIGQMFLEKSDFNSAVFWYKSASDLTPNIKSGGFIESDYYDFIPYIQLAVCYDKLADYKTAAYYNELAGKIKPSSTVYLHNKEYFEKVRGIDQNL